MSLSDRTPGYRNRSQVPPMSGRPSKRAKVVPGRPFLQMDGAADAGDPGAYDQDVDVFRGGACHSPDPRKAWRRLLIVRATGRRSWFSCLNAGRLPGSTACRSSGSSQHGPVRRSLYGVSAPTTTLPPELRLTHLRQLEAEAIHIMREVVAQFERPVMMYSIGKDSTVLLHLARKAFFPGKIPFPAAPRGHHLEVPGDDRVPRPYGRRPGS